MVLAEEDPMSTSSTLVVKITSANVNATVSSVNVRNVAGVVIASVTASAPMNDDDRVPENAGKGAGVGHLARRKGGGAGTGSGTWISRMLMVDREIETGRRRERGGERDHVIVIVTGKGRERGKKEKKGREVKDWNISKRTMVARSGSRKSQWMVKKFLCLLIVLSGY